MQFTPLPITHQHLWKHLLEGNFIRAQLREWNTTLKMEEDPQAWKLRCREEAFSHSLTEIPWVHHSLPFIRPPSVPQALTSLQSHLSILVSFSSNRSCNLSCEKYNTVILARPTSSPTRRANSITTGGIWVIDGIIYFLGYNHWYNHFFWEG